jgi:hypothetical protein
MNTDPDRNRKPPADEDDARTDDAKHVAEDYANGLREIIKRLRRWFN